jgi:dihydroorotate dehydrogenase
MRNKALHVKIALCPFFHEIEQILDSTLSQDIDDIVAIYKTLVSNGLSSQHYSEFGGFKGTHSDQKSNDTIAYIGHSEQGQESVIGVGGVFSAMDTRQKLAAGVLLVQLSTGLIYQGLAVAGRTMRAL